jgi:hypothetical protein
MKTQVVFLFTLVMTVMVTACSPPSSAPTPTPIAPTNTPTRPSPTETAVPEATPTPSVLAFEAATYVDETAGFQLDHPAAWESVFMEGQARGEIVQLMLDGEPQMDVVTLQWDPKDDLDAYLQVRETAFESSRFTTLSKEELTLVGGWRGVAYRIETVDGKPAFFFIAAIGDSYLQLSGSGDADLLTEIASTVRPLDG